MSEAESDDKQFDATEQKLRKAREKGDFPRSTEVNAALAYLGAMAAAAVAVAWAVPGWLGRAAKTWEEMGAPSTETGVVGAGAAALDAALGVWGSAALFALALISLPAAVILIGMIAQRGIVFVPSKLAFDIKRINPIKNAGQKFGKNGLATFLISMSKAAAVGFGGWQLFKVLLPRLIVSREETAWISGLEIVISWSLVLALAISIVFAVVDLGWKHFDFRRRNRMSLKEMKDEMKDSEGDPHMKSARRQRSMEIALSSMLADVEKADVVIVNPTHYAVALQWKRGSGRAPVCVAKGVDAVALRIRDRAREHAVPIWPDPPAARAIHAGVKLGAEIEPEHFAAVAAAIRFAEAMRQKMKRGW
ncbi:flagellar type III secretion system protein FlhB [Paracoccus xiamenensis]|uniref:flagellar type III secretion system protein FlhB n=1 Tax=Paracoccus xiamenensis TaxID=2714901 RepID=UPI00140AD0BB|nr:flagellar type III secretion system protein FlhB [Paracoccus xiamenensis]NHF73151.1 flagellar biosynthesis protein FlhB [Paracoccus xiamenensis]